MPTASNRSLLLAAAVSAVLTAGRVSGFAADMQEGRPAAAAEAKPGTAAAQGEQELESADAYRARVGEEVDRWKDKVESYSSDARQKGTEAGNVAADQVEDAWDRVKSEWTKLQGARDDTWQKTKAAFERAWDDFQEAWRSATNS